MSDRFNCSSLISRYAAGLTGFMAFTSNIRPPMDEAAAERHFVCDAGQAIAGRGLGDTRHLEQDHAGLDHGGPEFGFALALAHARLGRNRGHRLVRKHANVQPALAAHEMARGDAARFNGLGAQPAPLQELQAELAESHGVAAAGVTFYLSPLAFSKLYPLGH